jgi:hypothetical protein
MRELTIAILATFLTLTTACTKSVVGVEANSSEKLEIKVKETVTEPFPTVEPLIISDTDKEGKYMNHGRILSPNVRYQLWGVNGCNAMFLYGSNGTAAVTHYDPRPEASYTNALKLAELAADHRFNTVEYVAVTFFYTAPLIPDHIPQIAQGAAILTQALKTVFGTETRVRYQPYLMTPPGTNAGTPSLVIDLAKNSLSSVWHGELGITFEGDQSFSIPVPVLE